MDVLQDFGRGKEERIVRELYLIAYVIVPIFLIMVLGYFISRRKTMSREAADQMNSMVFKYLLPVQLFMNIYTSTLSEALNWKLILYSMALILLVFCALNALIPKVYHDRRKNVPMIHAMFRSNYVIFGLVVVGGFYPEQLAVPSVLAAFVVPMFNLLGVILLERGGTEGTDLKTTLIGIVKNPLITSSLLGIVFNLLAIPLPEILVKFLKDVAAIATPMALLAIGMRFEFSSIRDNLKPMAVTLAFRLFLLPLVAVGIGILLGFRDVELMTVLIIFGSPTAVATYTLSQGYDVDHSLANLLVVSATLCSVLSMFLLLMLFSHTPFMRF